MTFTEIINKSVYADTNLEALHLAIEQATEEAKYRYSLRLSSMNESFIQSCENAVIRTEKSRQIVNEYLSRIDDPEIRQIIHYKYFKRKTWDEVNIKIYGYRDSQYSFRRLTRYFESRQDDLKQLEDKLNNFS